MGNAKTDFPPIPGKKEADTWKGYRLQDRLTGSES